MAFHPAKHLSPAVKGMPWCLLRPLVMVAILKPAKTALQKFEEKCLIQISCHRRVFSNLQALRFQNVQFIVASSPYNWYDHLRLGGWRLVDWNCVNTWQIHATQNFHRPQRGAIKRFQSDEILLLPWPYINETQELSKLIGSGSCKIVLLLQVFFSFRQRCGLLVLYAYDSRGIVKKIFKVLPDMVCES